MRLPILSASQPRARGKAKVSAAVQLRPEVDAGPRRASARHLRTEPTFRAEAEVRTVRQHRAVAPFRAAPGADRVAMQTL